MRFEEASSVTVRKIVADCFDCRPGERVFSGAMSACFFLVISTFWILKPIKKTVFIGQFDVSGVMLLDWHLSASQAELVAKILNMVVAFGAVVVFTWLSRRFQRQWLMHIFGAFFLVCFAAFSLVMTRPTDTGAWSFYLLGDLFSTLMVTTFFAFLNDSVSSDEAKRLYGIVGFGGVVGGVVGSTFVGVWIDAVSTPAWLWICVGTTLGIMASAQIASRHALRAPPPGVDAPRSPPLGNVVVEGARLVFRSDYLLAIVAIVGLYEIASTITDFMFTATVTHYLSGAEIGRQFSRVFAITNWASMFVQLFLTSLVMTKLGLTTALMVLPLALLSGSVAFLTFPVLWVGSLLNTSDNAFSYSINQSAKEVLYVPTTREQKYRAKAFIDMFVQRFAKSVAVVVSLVVSTLFAEFESVRWLAIINASVVIMWLIAARYAGRAFHTKADRTDGRTG
jgi:AAA family ATP:ADP antiporter